MRTEIKEMKFDAWRHGLLDISKRNRLMSYRRSKRATLHITYPTLADLYQRLVVNGESLSFRRQIDAGNDLHLSQLFYIMDKMGATVELAEGEVRSDLSAAEMNQTLKNLRSKAKLSQEEQGINILYLSFGFLQWRQKASDPYMLSPLVLVPISLELESILSPYNMRRLEEDIVVNPTLEYALSAEYGISLPDFDPLTDDIEAFLDEINHSVAKNGWAVLKETNLGLLSFLKIVMYKDLEKYKDRIFANPVVQAFCGDASALPQMDDALRQFPHDQTPAMDICQVVNADASQQDAVLLSRNGASFVLQGPPGTGKSQTITNIIAQALADKKKVLFVSEKMAALSVVYRRLEDVGLADYCLSLHNYKAERRAVIQDLVNTLDAPTRSVKAGVTDALAVLEDERSQLNAYISEMNKLRQPLNKTIFEAITELVSLEQTGFFRISEETRDIGEKDFAARISVLRKLSDFLEQYTGNIYENPWKGSTISVITYDIRNAITKQLGTLNGYLFGISSSLSYLEQKYELDRSWTLNDFNALIRQMIGALLVRKTETMLQADVGEPVFSRETLEGLEGAYHRLNSACGEAASAGIASDLLNDSESIERAHRSLAEQKAHVERASALIQALRQSLSIDLPDSHVGLIQGKALLLAMNIRHAINAVWFRDNGFSAVRSDVYRWKEIADRAAGIRRKIEADWEQGFFSLDCDALLSRFSTEYTSFFKRLGSQYRADKARLLSVRRGHPNKLDDRDCIAGLTTLKAYNDALLEYNSATRNAAEVLGPVFHGIDTDWEELEHILNDCEPANEYFRNYGLSEVLLMHLEKPRAERIQSALARLEMATMESAIGAFDLEISATRDLAGTNPSQIEALGKKTSAIEAVVYAYSLGRKTLEVFMPKRLEAFQTTKGALACFGTLIKMVEAACDQKEAVDQYFENNKWPLTADFLQELEEMYEEYYDVEALREGVNGLKTAFDRLSAEQFCIGIAAVDRYKREMEQEEILRTYAAWFPEDDCHAMPLQVLADRIAQCQDIESLQSWMRFASIEKECDQLGIEEYLDYIESAQISSNEIIPLYRKSFLTKWLMDVLVLEDVPYLQNFQSYAHEKVISSFANSDKNQLQIAQARLIDWLSHEKPSGVTQLASAMDEVTILRREAEKKRRITPLRRLFKTIPTLLQKLKPCFMMSPLSVSYFLDSDMYSFDMVIFDEASQILPEDAIGAIYRGKQVIIAGDTKQMPPTSFFSSAAKNTDDYDVDEDSDEYYPDIVSESILDEATTCLPSCTLLWHYRSKDESLIAFSNQQLYNNNLITFPNCSRMEDRGLEYVYVPNGYYEGSGKNCNVMEARKCLSLVIEHIKKHPDRSLGIIAFSEKQQGVIEDVINDYRIKNPQYEDFFDEAKEEPFFVKNLENVQGDERDTIIFSICYAKNAQGRMYQRFGPLAHDGGERRLNVAITRAKYNVKLVGSIMPTDITVKEGTKEGVRMLREYIYYAMQNDYELPSGNGSAIDEPFADRISAFLNGNGYIVRRNIGTSAYKVDIAVEKPGHPEILIAGIECDGHNYTNARTARDRDVLRRSVMTDLGWRLYHVWSMAWYLNPGEEKRRLLDFLRECDAVEIDSTAAGAGFEPEKTTSEMIGFESLTDMEDRSLETHTITFEAYEYANPWEAPYDPGKDNYWNLSRRIMWVMEREHPIHKEELYRRLAAVFGNAKATAPVRRTVDDCIVRRLSAEIEERGDFYYLKGAAISARAPGAYDEPRSIDHIAPEELQDAMTKILDFAYGLTPKALIGETARQLGYARTGPRINSILEENWKNMLASGALKESNGKLYCVEVND